MLPYFIWKGMSTLDKNIIVNRLPAIMKAERSVQKIEVPGRHGFLTIDDRTYKGKIKVVEATLKNGNIDDVASWLTGEDEVIFSNEPDRKYKAVIISQIDFNKILTDRFKKFTVIFDCQPFAYAVDNNVITLTAPGTIYNPCTAESEPIITVYGSGDITLTINGENIYLYNVTDYVTIDSMLMDAYKDTILKNNDMLGEFPELIPGENSISWTGNVAKIEITPNWRWL